MTLLPNTSSVTLTPVKEPAAGRGVGRAAIAGGSIDDQIGVEKSGALFI
jgi:hypothetical protein